MPSVINFDAFRLRWRSKSFAKPLSPPNEDDSDRSSSPERVERRISFHFTTPNNADERPRNLQKTLPELPTGGTSKQSHVELMNEKSSTHFLEQPVEATEKRVGLLRSTTNIHKLSPPTTKPPSDMKPSLIRRVTSKLHITVPAVSQPKSSPPHIAHIPADVKHFSRPPRSPRVILPRSPTLPNSFASRENREAALRERGLLPPKKDLSEQEREADKRLATLPVPDKDQSGSSAASKIKEEWLSINRSCEARASDSGTAFYPRQLPSFGALASGVSPLSHSASPSLPQSPTCDSDSTRADLNPEMSFIARSSISSSVPPLSPSSHLEVLEEEPAEHVPPTPPPPPPQFVHPPIVVSTPVEDYFPPGDTALPESPVSCTFSSYLAPPGSSSQPHTSPPVLPDKENSYSPFPAPPSRRRTTESNVRRRSSVATSLSKFGTNSLTNLRRSIGSVRYSGSSADLSSTSSHLSSPRVSVRPTMHNRGSILLETKGIQDAESRRLSELAFLD